MRKIAEQQRAGVWPEDFGGVKVVEVHPGGHGVHFHWVVKPRIPIKVLLSIGRECGFGRISVHEKPATEKLAKYLVKYLCKGEKLSGLKRWSCIGDFKGVKAADVEFLSDSVQVFRDAYREAIKAGKPRGAAWRHAKAEQRKFDHNSDARLSN